MVASRSVKKRQQHRQCTLGPTTPCAAVHRVTGMSRYVIIARLAITKNTASGYLVRISLSARLALPRARSRGDLRRHRVTVATRFGQEVQHRVLAGAAVGGRSAGRDDLVEGGRSPAGGGAHGVIG